MNLDPTSWALPEMVAAESRLEADARAKRAATAVARAWRPTRSRLRRP